jgi:hypothetical protein
MKNFIFKSTEADLQKMFQSIETIQKNVLYITYRIDMLIKSSSFTTRFVEDFADFPENWGNFNCRSDSSYYHHQFSSEPSSGCSLSSGK